MNKRYEKDTRITIYGSGKEINIAESALDVIADLPALDEPKARILIQAVIDGYKVKASICFSGNSVWSKTRLIRDVKRIKAKGMNEMSDYFYRFVSLVCGSIAHYDLNGWISVYPSISDLRNFFRKNEFGNRVIDQIPNWHTDVKLIVAEIEKILGI
jgi:hypothetical protein